MAANLSCPNCSQPLPVDHFVAGQPMQCPGCHTQVEAYTFPEFHRDPSSHHGIHLAPQDGTVCYFHSRYRALTPCDNCGRFLCEICAINVGDRQLCAECFSQLRNQKNETGLVHYAALFDNVALFLVIAPTVTLFFWIFTIFTAPISLFLSLFYWSRQWNLVRRSRLRFAIAILLSVLLIAFWAFVFYYAATHRK